MSTIDYPKLSQGQIKIIHDSIDTNRDSSMSIEELEDIVRSNSMK